jgi:glycosyltransferase involved in cell wall biosynthesis
VADDLTAFVGVPRKRIAVIHNPLLLPATLPDPAAAAARWPAGTRRILAVGALKVEKNYPLLLRALARVRERAPASLLILGSGPLQATLEAEAKRLNLRDAVVFAGFTTDPWPFYAAADLFVLSSDAEGFGNVLIEAMHAGLPVVSTDCPNGPSEILDGGRLGPLVSCGDHAALAEAMLREMTATAARETRTARALELAGDAPLAAHTRIMSPPR